MVVSDPVKGLLNPQRGANPQAKNLRPRENFGLN